VEPAVARNVNKKFAWVLFSQGKHFGHHLRRSKPLVQAEEEANLERAFLLLSEG
jgi:hypothetical protein